MNVMVKNNHGEVDQDEQDDVTSLVPQGAQDFSPAGFPFFHFPAVVKGVVGDIKEYGQQEQEVSGGNEVVSLFQGGIEVHQNDWPGIHAGH